jgi:peptidoglycan/LPS O-acetylase OafA/YrhL
VRLTLALTARGRPRLAHIEGLRAVAVLTVLATHIALLSGFTAANPLGPLTARLNVGVALFFVLSAYLLYRPFVEARLNGATDPDVRRYAVRRVLRILPAYLVALVILGALLPDEAPGVFGSDWWAYFGLLQVYFEDTGIGGLGVTWSLSTEVAFYLVLPVLAWAAARLLAGRPRALQVRLELVLLAVSVAAAFAVRHVVVHEGWMRMFPNTLIGKWPWFAVGLALAVIRAAWGAIPAGERPPLVRSIRTHPWAWWAVAAAILLFAAYGGVLPRHVFLMTAAEAQTELLLYALFTFCLAAPILLHDAGGPRGPAALLALVPVAWLGAISYGIFLWHYPLARWTLSWTSGNAWVYAAVTCALAIGCAAISWYAVERPCMRLAVGRRSSPATVARAELSEPAP